MPCMWTGILLRFILESIVGCIETHHRSPREKGKRRPRHDETTLSWIRKNSADADAGVSANSSELLRAQLRGNRDEYKAP